MRPELPGERDRGVADAVMLLATLSVGVGTWSCLAKISAVPLWRFYCGVGLTFVLALAGLTRRERWADAIRFLMGIWTIIFPFILGLPNAPAIWMCLTIGILLTALSIPGVIREKGHDLMRRRGSWGVMMAEHSLGGFRRP
jgi:hypothetical protein